MREPPKRHGVYYSLEQVGGAFRVRVRCWHRGALLAAAEQRVRSRDRAGVLIEAKIWAAVWGAKQGGLPIYPEEGA